MENISTIQDRIKEKRRSAADAQQTYFDALQNLGLARQAMTPGTGQTGQAGQVRQTGQAGEVGQAGQTGQVGQTGQTGQAGQSARAGQPAPAAPSDAEILSKLGARDAAIAALQTETDAFNKAASPQEWIGQVLSDLPFLLLPVRVEARYVTVKHVVRSMNMDDTLDISKDSAAEPLLQATGFEKDEEGVMTYRIPSLHVYGAALDAVKKSLQDGSLKPKSGQFIQRKNDGNELRIRIYPDDIFFEGLEQYLTADEWDAGISFWQDVCAGKDPRDEWMLISTAVKPARAAWIVHVTQPSNFTPDKPLPAKPVFPAGKTLKDGPYTSPPLTRLLPDRFVVRLYKAGAFTEFTGLTIPEPLIMGLDPSHDPLDKDPGSGMINDGTTIRTPPYLDWIHDFDAAEKAGMGIRIDLAAHPEFADGVDKIIVLGTKLSADPVESARIFSDLLNNHLYKEDGMGILAKGTPTNNSGIANSIYNDDLLQADLYFRSQWLPAAAPIATDESRLLQALGIGNGLRIPGGSITDISESLLMNELLWPATWGYYLLQFFSPVLSEAGRELARQFFTRYVSGRGMLPVLRINRQPYGIVQTSSWKDWTYAGQGLPEGDLFAAGAWTNVMSKMNAVWQSLTSKIKTVNVGGNGLDDNFFSVLGATASSSMLQRHWAAGTEFSQVLTATQADATKPNALFEDTDYQPAAFAGDMASAGFDPSIFAPINTAYHGPFHEGESPLIDGLPASEDRTLSLITGKAWNILQWLQQGSLIDLWNFDLTNIPAGAGVAANQAEGSAFAVLARQAMLRASLEAGLRIVEPQPGICLLKARDFEFIHLQSATLTIDPHALDPNNLVHQAFKPAIDAYQVSDAFQVEPDKRLYFGKSYPSTGTLSLADWLNARKRDAATPLLPGMMGAIDILQQRPTAALERLFMEHLDLCSHRLDAWMSGLIAQRLEKQRTLKPEGLYLGAFGYLMDLQPNAQPALVFADASPVYQPSDPANIETSAIPLVHTVSALADGIDLSGTGRDRSFFYIGSDPAVSMRLNTIAGKVEPAAGVNASNTDGYLHAPSVSHATAAAILRAGWLNHQTDGQAALVSLQLNSPRVRQALDLLECMEAGASLAESLGYHFERILHDRQLDNVLFDLRKVFALQRTGNPGPGSSMLTTIDGMALLNSRRGNPGSWLTGVAGIPPDSIPLIDGAAQALEDYLDSLGDLLLAESVYQTAKGNIERAGAALRILNGGGQAVLPDFVRTPMRGSAITHRVGMIFPQQAPGGASTGWTVNGTPRALLMPDINDWLSLVLPAPSTLAISVSLPGGVQNKLYVADLGLEPIDLLYATPDSFAGAGQSPLAAYVQAAAVRLFKIGLPIDGKDFSMDCRDRTLLLDEELSIFEISSLLDTARKMIKGGRPMSPNDFLLPDKTAAATDKIDSSRLENALIGHTGPGSTASLLIDDLRTKAAALDTAIGQGGSTTRAQTAAADLLASLLQAWQSGIALNTADGIFFMRPGTLAGLVKKGNDAAAALESALLQTGNFINAIPAAAAGQARYDLFQQAAAMLFGENIRLFPDVALANADEVKRSYEGRQSIQHAGADELDDWMREASLVRKNLQLYRRSVLLKEAILPTAAAVVPTVLQFPFFDHMQQPWIGGMIPADQPDEQRASLSIVAEIPDGFQPASLFAGLIVDEWPEWIPAAMVDSGLAFQYDQPNTEPPQSMLLAVTPVEGGNWVWDHLIGAVDDALEMAKTRLITLSNIRESRTGVAHALPAVFMPFMPDNKQTPVVVPE